MINLPRDSALVRLSVGISSRWHLSSHLGFYSRSHLSHSSPLNRLIHQLPQIYIWWHDLARDLQRPVISEFNFFTSSRLVDSCQIVRTDVSRDDLSPILNFLSSKFFVPSSSIRIR
ncbi:hypothetical protein QCA50_011445 [Cerrena zonata]|uniref:Maturase K n=1 Tax=Cerrena zonata TaxID=2478898 RepID=A0AAW0G6J0_9APHY